MFAHASPERSRAGDASPSPPRAAAPRCAPVNTDWVFRSPAPGASALPPGSRVSAPHDPLEVAADRLAATALAAAPAGDRLRPAAPAGTGGPGRPLDPAVCDDMSRRFGHDFSDVRIHTGPAAAASAAAIGASAYTFGSSIVFGGGQHEPHTAPGRRLLAHELAHVVQQRQGQGAGVVHRSPAKCDQTLTGVSKTGTAVMFTKGSSTLDATEQTKLSNLVDQWRDMPVKQIVIDGYASTVPADNKALSCERAAAVKAQIVAAGVPADRVKTRARGQTSGFGPKATDNQRAMIEVVTTASTTMPSITVGNVKAKAAQDTNTLVGTGNVVLWLGDFTMSADVTVSGQPDDVADWQVGIVQNVLGPMDQRCYVTSPRGKTLVHSQEGADGVFYADRATSGGIYAYPRSATQVKGESTLWMVQPAAGGAVTVSLSHADHPRTSASPRNSAWTAVPNPFDYALARMTRFGTFYTYVVARQLSKPTNIVPLWIAGWIAYRDMTFIPSWVSGNPPMIDKDEQSFLLRYSRKWTSADFEPDVTATRVQDIPYTESVQEKCPPLKHQR